MDPLADAQTGAPRIVGAACVVVKIGSALLVDRASGVLRSAWLTSLAADVAWLRGQGTRVVLVSSGSIALGRRVLGIEPGQGRLDEIQAAASVGQIQLARSYQDALSAHGLTAAQILLTLEDSAQRRRYLNTRATLRTLLDMGVVPVVNENDTVATDEIRYGDNDRLAAQVASLAQADRLVLLSDVDGLYTGDPRQDPTARHLPVISDLTQQIEAMAGGAGTLGAKGGMKTKLMAARVAMKAGADMAITLGEGMHPLRALADGARASWFLAGADPRTSRKQWISAMKPKGRISVDAGAARALLAGNSLLAAGVTGVTGPFERGDPVEICGPGGALVTLGLTGYDAADASAIKGLKSADIPIRLGYPARAALVHRDDMAI